MEQKLKKKTEWLTGGHGEFSFSLQDDLASIIHGWQHALLKEYNVLFVQAKKVLS